MTLHRSNRRPAGLLACLMALSTFGLTTTVAANEFTVTLKNGSTFETRYRPVQAEWDANVTMFMTDRGNWVAVENSDIADVISRAEESGYGYRLDSTTLYLGESPGVDLSVDDAAAGTGGGGDPSNLPPAADGSGYSIHQFLTTPVAGSPTSTSGTIPVGGFVGEEN